MTLRFFYEKIIILPAIDQEILQGIPEPADVNYAGKQPHIMFCAGI